jgi:Trypsin-co-occurring domain 2
MGEEQPSLGQLIWLVRRELEWAYGVDATNPLRFEVGSVELDVTVEATKTGKGGVGLDLKVLGVGASADGSRESARGTSSRVHVVLTPLDMRRPGGKYEISAMDTEPPPRRTEITDEQIVSSGSDSGRALGARDTELLPGS